MYFTLPLWHDCLLGAERVKLSLEPAKVSALVLASPGGEVGGGGGARGAAEGRGGEAHEGVFSARRVRSQHGGATPT